MGESEAGPAVEMEKEEEEMKRVLLLDGSGPVTRPLWDPRTGRMEETNNRALQLLDQLMDRPWVDIEAFKRVVDICDEEGEAHSGN